MKRLGIFEKWNKESGTPELSLTSIQMAVFTIFAMFFIYQYYITEANDVTVNSLMLIVIVLLGAFAPKAIKGLTDLKNKIK